MRVDNCIQNNCTLIFSQVLTVLMNLSDMGYIALSETSFIQVPIENKQ